VQASATRGRLAAAAVAGQGLLIGALMVPARRDRPRRVVLAGRVLSALGAVGLVGSARGLGRALTPSPIPVDGAVLRTDGPYAVVRHPIYSFLLLVAAGRLLSCGARRAWAALALTVLIGAKARWEERLLTERFPGYRAYADRTPRFVPRPLTRGRHRRAAAG
jgi:protein-S-isoprenylcysteine O-methyltransferase Ste14